MLYHGCGFCNPKPHIVPGSTVQVSSVLTPVQPLASLSQPTSEEEPPLSSSCSWHRVLVAPPLVQGPCTRMGGSVSPSKACPSLLILFVDILLLLMSQGGKLVEPGLEIGTKWGRTGSRTLMTTTGFAGVLMQTLPRRVSDPRIIVSRQVRLSPFYRWGNGGRQRWRHSPIAARLGGREGSQESDPGLTDFKVCSVRSGTLPRSSALFTRSSEQPQELLQSLKL